jgi:sugar lactone lactonase YvrE
VVNTQVLQFRVTANIQGSGTELIVGARDGMAKLDPKTGNISYLCNFWNVDGLEKELRYEFTHLPPANTNPFSRLRCNDGAVDSRGRFWVGTLNDQPTKSSSNYEGILFRVDGDLTVHSMLESLHAPNGIGWNLADDVMLFTDSDDKNIYAFDFDAERGAISNKRVFYNVVGENIFPDGLAVDHEDCVWSALWGGGKVLRISPDGLVIGEVIVPTLYVTCPAFIGTELLITTRGDPGIAESSIERGGDVYKVDVRVRGALKHGFCLIGS